MTRSLRIHLSLLLSAASLVPLGASANERHFTYTYETGVLPPGARELEIWTTPRMGRRGGYFSRFDERIELEVGVTDRLLTAFYLNFEAATVEVADNALETELSFGGVSSEWKLKLLDPVADPIGLGLYFEASISTNEYELEGKILLDKRIGNLLIAFNLVIEQEWEMEDAEETESELALEADFGVAYFLLPGLSVGLEIRDHQDKFERATFFAGPVIAFARPDWWAAFTFMPQLGTLGLGNAGLDLTDHERFNARLIFSFHI